MAKSKQSALAINPVPHNRRTPELNHRPGAKGQVLSCRRVPSSPIFLFSDDELPKPADEDKDDQLPHLTCIRKISYPVVYVLDHPDPFVVWKKAKFLPTRVFWYYLRFQTIKLARPKAKFMNYRILSLGNKKLWNHNFSMWNSTFIGNEFSQVRFPTLPPILSPLVCSKKMVVSSTCWYRFRRSTRLRKWLVISRARVLFILREHTVVIGQISQGNILGPEGILYRLLVYTKPRFAPISPDKKKTIVESIRWIYFRGSHL